MEIAPQRGGSAEAAGVALHKGRQIRECKVPIVIAGVSIVVLNPLHIAAELQRMSSAINEYLVAGVKLIDGHASIYCGADSSARNGCTACLCREIDLPY